MSSVASLEPGPSHEVSMGCFFLDYWEFIRPNKLLVPLIVLSNHNSEEVDRFSEKLDFSPNLGDKLGTESTSIEIEVP